MPEQLFNNNNVTQKISPYNLCLQTFFPCCAPDKNEIGEIGLVFRGGEKNKTQGIFMDTIVQCPKLSIERSPHCWDSHQEIVYWAEKAHDVAHACFFTLIKGELEKKFS
jgi:hypothetical protein